MDPTMAAIEDEAIGWVIALREPAFADWEGFEAWLSADPIHAGAYHRMAAAEADLDLLVPPAPVEPRRVEMPPMPRRSRRLFVVGGAMAAAIAGLIGYAALPTSRDLYAVETTAGEHRVVALAGSRIALNGGTRVTLDRRDVRFAALERGQAMFDVRHDAAHPFRVEVAGATLVDAGTAFEVTRERGTLEVDVSQGLVIYNPGREGVKLPAGTGLRTGDADAQLALVAVTPMQVGAWREGRLDYDGAPISRVAADLARNLGVGVEASPAVAARPFRGVISLDGGDDAVMARIGPVLGVGVVRSGQGWVLTGRR